MKFTWRNLLCFIGIHLSGTIKDDARGIWFECSNCLWKEWAKREDE